MFHIVENHGLVGLACVEEGWEKTSAYWGYAWHVFRDDDKSFATAADAKAHVAPLLDTWTWHGDVSWRTQYMRHVPIGEFVVGFDGFDDDDNPIFETEDIGGDYRRARDVNTFEWYFDGDVPEGYEIVQPGHIEGNKTMHEYKRYKNNVMVVHDHITINREALTVVCDTTDGVVDIPGTKAAPAYCGWVPSDLVTLETISYKPTGQKEIEYDSIELLEAAVTRFQTEGRWGLWGSKE